MLRRVLAGSIAGTTVVGTAITGVALAAPATASATVATRSCHLYQHKIETETFITLVGKHHVTVVVKSDAGPPTGYVRIIGGGPPSEAVALTPVDSDESTATVPVKRLRHRHTIHAQYLPGKCSPFKRSVLAPHHRKHHHKGHHHKNHHSDDRLGFSRSSDLSGGLSNAGAVAWSTASCGGTQVFTAGRWMPSSVLFCSPSQV